MSSPGTATVSTADEDTRALLLGATRAAAPVLAREAESAERHSRLTPEAAEALGRAGLFRLGVPRSFGGYEAGIVSALDVIAEVAHTCPSSAWIVMISYVAQRALTGYGLQAQQDLWATSPDIGMCGAFRADSATVSAADGGIRVSGRWSWASGCHHASWAWLAVPGIEQPQPPALALIPLADLRIEKTWNMAGMRGTGSDTVVAEDVFVPAHRIRAGTAAPLQLGSTTITMLGPLLGATREVLRRTIATVEAGKPLAMSFYPTSADSPSVRDALADASNLVDSAELHLSRSARFVDNVAAAGVTPTLAERARVRMDMAHASISVRAAMQLLLTTAGASTFRESSTIQRYWRDVETAARHPMLNTGLQRESYGRALVGDQSPVSPML